MRYGGAQSPRVPLLLTHQAQITTAALETSVIPADRAALSQRQGKFRRPAWVCLRRGHPSDALAVLKQGAHVSVGEEVAGGDAADGLMDVHASDLSGSSAIKVQPLLP